MTKTTKTNGLTQQQQQNQIQPPSSGGQSMTVWTALSQCLPKRSSEDSNEWWKLTGRHLAAIVEAAGYSAEKQYEALLFHYHWTVPHMGQAPRPDGRSRPLKWKSLLALDGTPIEYSWKWNTRTSPPNVRYVVEPIGPLAGTELDPLNQQATREILHGLAAVMPGLDNTWVNHFLATLYDHDNSRYMKEAAAGGHLGTTVQLAVELMQRGPAIKTYFFPRKFGQAGLMPVEQWEAAVSQLDAENTARASLHDFLKNSPEGRLLNPISLAVDNVAAAKSRLKWYFHTPHTSFASVREVMTLGGRLANKNADTDMDTLLADLESLTKAVNGLPDDFPADVPIPSGSELDSSVTNNFGDLSSALSGYLYYFDIAPGKSSPEIKLFIPTRYYGRDDLSLARALAGWMEAHGRGLYCRNYLNMLETLGEHRRLDDDKGLQTYVSVLMKDGELDVTTYLGAEAFHPGRLARRRRATLRRGDDDFV